MKRSTETSGQNTILQPSKIPTIDSKSGAAINLRDLLVAGLMDMYWSEKALITTILKMVKNATSKDLITDLEVHLEETRNQITRLEEVFELLEEKAMARKCVAMEGLINEAELIMQETEPGAVSDAGIIAAAQKIEHYEIASYGTLANFAKILGEMDAASILLEILAEEKEVDEALTELAESSINEEAMQSEQEFDESEFEEMNEADNLDDDDDPDEEEEEEVDEEMEEDEVDEEYINISAQAKRKY
jgi:ferritin-like metal-binding protein YciE